MTAKKGLLACMKIVLPQHELMLISEEGVVIRVKAQDVSKLGRSTQGVKVMNVSENDRVTAIARVAATAKKKPRAVLEGQTSLLEEAPEDEMEVDLAEELAGEEFEDDAE